MAINIGSISISDAKIGTNSLSAIYVGNTKIWPSSPTPEYYPVDFYIKNGNEVELISLLKRSIDGGFLYYTESKILINNMIVYDPIIDSEEAIKGTLIYRTGNALYNVFFGAQVYKECQITNGVLTETGNYILATANKIWGNDNLGLTDVNPGTILHYPYTTQYQFEIKASSNNVDGQTGYIMSSSDVDDKLYGCEDTITMFDFNSNKYQFTYNELNSIHEVNFNYI